MRVRRAAWLPVVVALALGAAAAAEPMPAGVTRGRVTRVFDGDTLEVVIGDRPHRVRLIGIDTPETRRNRKLDRDAARTGRSPDALRALGRAAAAFTREAALGREVGLELDVQREDRYGRLLAYVWLPDGRLLNAELLAHGHARLMTIPPNVRHADTFRRLQREARDARRGLWRAPEPVPARAA